MKGWTPAAAALVYIAGVRQACGDLAGLLCTFGMLAVALIALWEGGRVRRSRGGA